MSGVALVICAIADIHLSGAQQWTLGTDLTSAPTVKFIQLIRMGVDREQASSV